ncbi:caspase family protein [Streptomyces sp. NPDC005799]|uniref:caspase family protein n=1 Tax=Streptomyces sp. NPDC005799 TaxID=3154678 RepID=UPI0033E3002E
MSALPDPALSRAVLIGVSSYVHLEPLPAVANNLPALAHVLTSSSSWDLPEGHCTVVAEPDSTPAMLDAVQQAAEVAEDTLLIYFAGHGLLDGRGDLFFGLPRSTAGRSHTGVTYQALREILTDASAQRYVIILDCCLSGRALGSMSSDEMLADQAEIEGSYLLAAAPDNGLALAPPGETHTAFTGELLHLLRDGIPGPARDLDLDLVYRQLRTTLGARAATAAKTRPQHRRTTHPRPQSRLPAGTGERTSRPGRHGVARSRTAPHPARLPAGPGRGESRQRPHPRRAQPARRSAHLHGSISALLNRSTLPRTWKTTGIYLTACGLPPEQTEAWKAAWQRLRATEPATRPAPPAADAAPAPRTWRARLGRGKRRP